MAKNKKTNSNRPNKKQPKAALEKNVEKLVKLELKTKCAQEIMEVTGGLDRTDELISRAYLFLLYAIQTMDELADMMEIYNMKFSYAKPALDKTRRDMDDFCTYVYNMIKENGEEYKKKAVDNVCKELALLEKMFFENFPQYSKEWQPKDDKEAIEKVVKKYGFTVKVQRESNKVSIYSSEDKQ